VGDAGVDIGAELEVELEVEAGTVVIGRPVPVPPSPPVVVGLLAPT